MSTETPPIIDALPYVDTAIDDDEHQRAIAMKELDDELDVFPPQKDYLERLQPIEPRPFCTPLIRHEHECLDNNQSRPPPSNPTTTGEDSLKQLKIKLEYLGRQSLNLDLIKSYGSVAWQNFIEQNENIETELKGELEHLERKIQEVNWHRKTEQELVQKTLQVLRGEWISYVEKNRILSHEVERIYRQTRN